MNALLNDAIDFVEVPCANLNVTSPDPVEQRVDQTFQQLDRHWEMLAADPSDEQVIVDYYVPDNFKLSVVIPVYNERSTVMEILSKVHALPLPTEIIVVDDCSTDGTRSWLETMRGASGLKIIHHPRNLGKGAALRTGFQAATGNVVAIQDADLEYDPRDLVRLIRPIVTGHADVVYGSRFLGNRLQDRSPFHRFVNYFLTTVSNLFTGLHLTDMETCHKAFRRHFIQDLRLRQDRFGFEPEVTAKIARRRLRVAEVPVSYRPRGYSEGKKIGIRDAWNAIYCIVRYGISE